MYNIDFGGGVIECDVICPKPTVCMREPLEFGLEINCAKIMIFLISISFGILSFLNFKFKILKNNSDRDWKGTL